MAILDDIRKSISKMDEEELVRLHKQIRENRLYRGGGKQKVSKISTLKRLGITKEMLQEMLDKTKEGIEPEMLDKTKEDKE